MITRRTKIQLVVFVVITLLGCSYVGAKYAQLDKVIMDTSYEVVAHYPESGGIFVGAEVTYRGVRIGQVNDMVLTDEGVDVVLEIENKWEDTIPADTKALVGNRSAVGEQYVELQPNVDPGKGVPVLKDGSEIIETGVPIRTEKLLADVSETVASVNRKALQTTIKELGIAFGGTGDHLQQIIDTGNAFIREADKNFDVTSALITDGNTVLQGQLDSESSLRTFATELSAFSDTLVGADQRSPQDHRHRVVLCQPAAHLPGAERRSAPGVAAQPGHHRRDRRPSAARDRALPGDLPVGRRRYVERGVQEQRPRWPLRRALRPDPQRRQDLQGRVRHEAP